MIERYLSSNNNAPAAAAPGAAAAARRPPAVPPPHKKARTTFARQYLDDEGNCMGCGSSRGKNISETKDHMLQCFPLLDKILSDELPRPEPSGNQQLLQDALQNRAVWTTRQQRLVASAAGSSGGTGGSGGAGAGSSAASSGADAALRRGSASSGSWVTRVSHERLQRQLEAIMEWPIKAGVAFNVLDTPPFQELMLELAPHLAGRLPSGRQSAAAVDAVFKDVFTAAQKALSCIDEKGEPVNKQLLEKLEKCFLILDSWTNKNNKHLVGVNVLFGGISVNIDAIPMEGGVRETGDHIKERVLAAVKLFPGLDKRIGGVVTDWGKNFRNAASQLVACDELPSCLVEVGCIQHGLNNGLKDCAKEGGDLPEVHAVIDDINTIVKWVRGKNAVAQLYALLGANRRATKLQPPAKTRFATNLITLLSYINNHKTLVDVVDSDQWREYFAEQTPADRETARQMRANIKDPILVAKATWLYNTLQPVLNLIRQLESDTALLADAYFGKLALLTHFKEVEEMYTTMTGLLLRVDDDLPEDVLNLAKVVTPKIRAKFDKRLDDSTGDAHIAAALLDPRYYHRQQQVPAADVMRATTYIEGLAKKLHGDADAAAAKASRSFMLYRSSLTHLGLTPLQVQQVDRLPARAAWDTMKLLAPELHAVAQLVVFAPPSSASVERLFSAAGLLATAKRNRLSAQRLRRLLFIFFNERALKRQGAARSGEEFAAFDKWLGGFLQANADDEGEEAEEEDVLAYAIDPVAHGGDADEAETGAETSTAAGAETGAGAGTADAPISFE